MENLSEEEREGIEELISALKESDSPVQPEEDAAAQSREGATLEEEADSASPPVDEKGVAASQAAESEAEVASEEHVLRRILHLQNDRLSVLSRKVDALTRMVELLLTSNFGRRQ